MECLSCRSLSGEQRISPGPFIYEGTHWVIDHAYPTQLRGWLVLVLKRHAEALHELSDEEFAEMADLQRRVTRMLRQEFDCTKEYTICLAEAEGFAHIHIHMVPRPRDLPEHLKGQHIFVLLKADDAQALSIANGIVPPEEIVALSERLRAAFLRDA